MTCSIMARNKDCPAGGVPSMRRIVGTDQVVQKARQ